MHIRPIEILLIEDNPGDVRLTTEAFKDGKLANRVTVARDGAEAMALLRREGPYADAARPDLILLDLNLPKVSGQEILAALQADEVLAMIPVVVLTTSHEELDEFRSLYRGARAYMTKPVDFPKLLALVAEIETLRLSIVLPVPA
jgi:CheY-like chemotaxis protein